MTRLAGLTAAAVLLGGVATAGIAAADDGPQGGPMMMGRLWIDFAAIDTDQNGVLSRSELQARAVQRLGKADGNGDGALDRDEIIAVLPGPHGGIIDVFAADPGEAAADRLLALVGGTEAGRVEIAVLADRRVNMLLAVADTDRDAAISQAEADAVRDRMRTMMDRHHGWGHGDADGWREGRGQGGPGPDAPPAPPATPEMPRG